MTTKKSSKSRRYPFEFRLRAVTLYLEEGYSSNVLCEELGIGHITLNKWVRRYREEGKAGLEDRPANPNKAAQQRISPKVKAKAVELKKQDPKRGSRRMPPAGGLDGCFRDLAAVARGPAQLNILREFCRGVLHSCPVWGNGMDVAIRIDWSSCFCACRCCSDRDDEQGIQD